MHNRIKEIRTDQKMSMRKFGEAIGVSSAAVSHIENNDNGVSRKTIDAICDEFNVNPDWLRTGEGPKYLSGDNSFRAAARIVKEFVDEGDTFKKRFLEAISRLSPDQWDMVEQFMLDVISAKSAPDEPERGGEEAQSDTSSTTI